jgi:hypothetical protein
MVIEMHWLDKKSNMVIETEWLNMLLDRGENEGYVIQAHQVRFRSRMLDTLVSLSRTGALSFFPLRDSPLLDQGLLIIDASRSHSVGLLWISDKPDAQNAT